MASQSKLRKLKNSHFCGSCLKNTGMKIKRGLFFNASQRRKNNKQILNDIFKIHTKTSSNE